MKKNKKIILNLILVAIIVAIIILVIIIFYYSINPKYKRYSYPRSDLGIEIKEHNRKFTPYEGEGQTATQIRSLISTVEEHNKTEKNHFVDYIGPNVNELNEECTYLVELKYNSDTNKKDNGFINAVVVNEE